MWGVLRGRRTKFLWAPPPSKRVGRPPARSKNCTRARPTASQPAARTAEQQRKLEAHGQVGQAHEADAPAAATAPSAHATSKTNAGDQQQAPRTRTPRATEGGHRAQARVSSSTAQHSRRQPPLQQRPRHGERRAGNGRTPDEQPYRIHNIASSRTHQPPPPRRNQQQRRARATSTRAIAFAAARILHWGACWVSPLADAVPMGPKFFTCALGGAPRWPTPVWL